MDDKKIKLIEKNIKSSIVKTSKKYIGKGPEYIKVEINDDTINLVIKGITSNTGNILLKHMENNLVQTIWTKLKNSYEKEMSLEFYQITGQKVETISEASDFQEDVRTMVLKIVE